MVYIALLFSFFFFFFFPVMVFKPSIMQALNNGVARIAHSVLGGLRACMLPQD